MTGSALSGVPLGRSGADRFMNAKIKNLGGGFGGGMGKRSANWAVHRRIFFDTFFASVSLSFFAAVLEVFWWCRDLLFSVFTAEIQCFLRFHEVRRGMLFFMNFRLFLDHFGTILAVQKSLFLEIFCSMAPGCILG